VTAFYWVSPKGQNNGQTRRSAWIETFCNFRGVYYNFLNFGTQIKNDRQLQEGKLYLIQKNNVPLYCYNSMKTWRWIFAMIMHHIFYACVMLSSIKEGIKLRVKYYIGIWVLKILFFGTWVLEHDTCLLRHVSTHIIAKSPKQFVIFLNFFWVICQLCGCWHVARDKCHVPSGTKWQFRGGPLVFERKTWLRY
jgi:hypothetical protein